jgi:hypothetical protein
MKVTLPAKPGMLLNGAALIVAVASFSVVLRSMLAPEASPPCATRYSTATRLSLAGEDGRLYTAADLQAQASNTDWGLMEGARVVRLKTGPAKEAIELNLASVPRAANLNTPPGEKRPGLGFTWAPEAIGQPKAACLSYSIYIPAGFDMGQGIRLPGLAGGDTVKPKNARDYAPVPFSVRFVWDVEGRGDIFPELPDRPLGRSPGGRRAYPDLPRGKWVTLQQEVVMNAPGRKDGVLRAWVNDTLMLERTDVIYRLRPTVQLTGVLAEAVVGRPPNKSDKPDPARQRLWMTPFEIRWQ